MTRRRYSVIVTGIPERDNSDDDESAFLKLCEENLSVKPSLSRHRGVYIVGLRGLSLQTQKLVPPKIMSRSPPKSCNGAATVLICKNTDWSEWVSEWSRPRGWTVRYTFSQQADTVDCLPSHPYHGNDQWGVVQRRREVINSRRWSALIEHQRDRLPFYLVQWRQTWFKLTIPTTFTLVYITGTKGTGKVTANPPRCSIKGELGFMKRTGGWTLSTTGNSHSAKQSTSRWKKNYSPKFLE